MSIKSNFDKIEQTVKKAAIKTGRKASSISLVVAGKGRTIKQLETLINLGVKIIGENTAQELERKYAILGDKARWHFIGHLQRNKVDKVVNKVDMVHSLDSVKLAETINKKLIRLNKKMAVLIQVNASLESSKHGVTPDLLFNFISKINKFNSLKIEGLMTMGKLTSNSEDNKKYFETVVKLSKQIDQMKMPGVQMKYLSMGMSNDYEVAIEAGANMIRVGSALF